MSPEILDRMSGEEMIALLEARHRQAHAALDVAVMEEYLHARYGEPVNGVWRFPDEGAR